MYRDVLFLLDGSARSEEAIYDAVGRGWLKDAKVTLLLAVSRNHAVRAALIAHAAVDPFLARPPEEIGWQRLRHLGANIPHDSSIEMQVMRGKPGRVLRRHLRDHWHDLLIVGLRGKVARIDRLSGSGALEVKDFGI